MKMVHLEDFIHPDAGYQVNLLARLQVKDGHDVTIVTGEMDKIPTFLTAFFGRDNMKERDERFFRETGARIVRVKLFGFYSGRAIFYPRIFKVVDELNPDVLFLHGEDTLTGMAFIARSSRLKYPMILDCHSVEMASFNRLKHVFRFFYKRLVAPIIIRNNIPLIRVVDVDFVDKCLGIPLSHTTLLSFGTDTDHFQPNAEARARFIKEHGLKEDTFVVLYAGKLDVFKGGKFFASSIKDKIVSTTGKDVVFVIVGNCDGEYGREVEKLFSESENRIIRFPTQRYFDLASFYQAADMALYPKQCSMSFFEAQSCGLPLIFEDNEINLERATHGNALTFKGEDTGDFRAKLQQMIDMPAQQFQEMRAASRKYIVDNFDFVPIARKFTEVMQGALTRWKERKSRRAR